MPAGRRRHLTPLFLGGALGTAGRELLHAALPPGGNLPYPILLINLAGALLLGLLLAGLARPGPESGRARALRLTLGAGFLGGFTTYGAFALGVVALLQDGAVGPGLFYAVATVVAGAAATWAGAALGTLARGAAGGHPGSPRARGEG